MKNFRLSKYQSKRAVVFGTEYRWCINAPGEIVVQHGSGFGCCIVARVRGDFNSALAVALIKMALDADWDAGVDGGDSYYVFDTTTPSPSLTQVNRW